MILRHHDTTEHKVPPILHRKELQTALPYISPCDSLSLNLQITTALTNESLANYFLSCLQFFSKIIHVIERKKLKYQFLP